MDDLLNAVAVRIRDYRSGEIPAPDSAHVKRWIDQFPQPVREPILHEMVHVLTHGYISKNSAKQYIDRLVRSVGATATEQRLFWQKQSFLDIQDRSRSQQEMIKLFAESLREQLGIESGGSGSGADFVYVDDILFSGNRVASDLSKFARSEPPMHLRISVFTICDYRGGIEWATKRVNAVASETGTTIVLAFKSCRTFENRLLQRNQSEVLWPSSVSDDLLESCQTSLEGFQFVARSASVQSNIQMFSGEPGRQLLEQEFTRVGVHLRSLAAEPKPYIRPLGFSNVGLGFGGLTIPYRNCPNNAPLALWYGGEGFPPASPLSKWYPLFSRYSPYSSNTAAPTYEDVDDLPF